LRMVSRGLPGHWRSSQVPEPIEDACRHRWVFAIAHRVDAAPVIRYTGDMRKASNASARGARRATALSWLLALVVLSMGAGCSSVHRGHLVTDGSSAMPGTAPPISAAPASSGVPAPTNTPVASSTASSASGDAAAIAECQSVMARVAGAKVVIAGYRTTQGTYDAWRLVHDGREGLALSFTSATLASTAPRVICYYRGSFEVSQPIPGPLPDTVRAQIDANGVLTIDEIGHAATMVAQAPSAEASPGSSDLVAL
jgi:hypothetical protein